MNQLAVVHTEQIGRKGEIKYFQIPLPGTVKKIIAVEVSAQLFTAVEPLPAAATSYQPQATSTTPNAQSSTTQSCPNPGRASIDAVTDGIANNIRAQQFRIGAAVNPDFIYSCGVYSVVVSIVAIDGDTPATIAAKLAGAVNNTPLSTWSQYGSNNRNYKPTATAEGDLLSLTVDTQHSFYASGQGECFGAVSTPAPAKDAVQFDPLFIINANEKVGVLSLQSPDATDIFYQADAYREDKNIGYGDFTMPGEMVGEWLKGKKRFACDVLITTETPILEAYYKDRWGEYYDKDLTYQINIYIWYEKTSL